ncbi:hypothetical protein Ae201684P_004865 [Aphanomyces euteiches]|nr:hypothetical protein Ae201684P_004865 [Aphanomyces euteiches]
MAPQTSEALFTAIKEGDAEQFEEILAQASTADVNAIRKVQKDEMTPLMLAAELGHVDIVKALLGRDDIEINRPESKKMATPLIRACSKGHEDVVQMLLTCPKIDVNLKSENQCAIQKAASLGYITIVELLWDRVDDASRDRCVQTALQGQKYELVARLIHLGANVDPKFQGRLVLPNVARYLSLGGLVSMLLHDLPFQVVDNTLVPRPDQSYSWTTFLDARVSVCDDVSKKAVVEAILNHPMFQSVSRHLLAHELVYAFDAHEREAWTLADQDTRLFLHRLLCFAGRYEILEGSPVHVSATAVVVLANDHGICDQVFAEYAKQDGTLDVDGFLSCNAVLKQLSRGGRSSRSLRRASSSDVDVWMREFDSMDTSNTGTIDDSSFMAYCQRRFGLLQVAIKFMKNGDEYARELWTRQNLNSKHVLGLAPTEDKSFLDKHVHEVTLDCGDDQICMSDYPHVIVMPAATRSLEDIFLKERPSANAVRSMLEEVAAGLAHLHANNFVHGDLKKLNIMRVRGQLKLIDFDAAARVGDSIGAKFSSGILPPEMFYKLESDDELAKYESYWKTHNDGVEWEKVKPKMGRYVVKTFHRSADVAATSQLPYSLIAASPAVDSWAFGCMMYEMLSGQELVPTDVNQDVVADRIHEAASWTTATLHDRVEANIADSTARHLLRQLLVVDPSQRLELENVLHHSYFTGQPAIVVQPEPLLQAQSNKQEALSLLKEAAEVPSVVAETPTSLVLLPFRPTDLQPNEATRSVSNYVSQFTKVCSRFSDDVRNGKPIGPALAQWTSGQPMYLYLMDDLSCTLALTETGLYPLEVSPHDYAFLAMSLPLVQQSLNTLLKKNGISGLLPSRGNAPQSATREASVNFGATPLVTFEMFEKTLGGSHLPSSGQVRRAALRQLKLWFDLHDPCHTFAGLERVETTDGRFMWRKKSGEEEVEDGDDDVTLQTILTSLLEEEDKPLKKRVGQPSQVGEDDSSCLPKSKRKTVPSTSMALVDFVHNKSKMDLAFIENHYEKKIEEAPADDLEALEKLLAWT